MTRSDEKSNIMAKEKTAFFCKECGNESPKWFGKCPACGAWNTCVEETVVTGKDSKSVKKSVGLEMDKSLPTPINEIGNAKEQRIILPYEELSIKKKKRYEKQNRLLLPCGDDHTGK